MPTTLTDGGERLVRVETKLDDLIRELRAYMSNQADNCRMHHTENEEAHTEIWIAIDDIREMKWKIVGAGMAILFLWSVFSTVIAAAIVSVLGI